MALGVQQWKIIQHHSDFSTIEMLASLVQETGLSSTFDRGSARLLFTVRSICELYVSVICSGIPRRRSGQSAVPRGRGPQQRNVLDTLDPHAWHRPPHQIGPAKRRAVNGLGGQSPPVVPPHFHGTCEETTRPVADHLP